MSAACIQSEPPTIQVDSELHIFRMPAPQHEKHRDHSVRRILVQAVVRGRKLRQQLSCARQAAAYTDESSQQEAHDSDPDMDQMDDFLASLPDDEPPLAQASPLASLPAYFPSHASMPHCCLLSSSSRTGQDSSQPAVDVQSVQSMQSMQAGTGQQSETRRGSSVRATTSSIPPAFSLDISLPALLPQSNISSLAATTAHLAKRNSTPFSRKQVQQQQQHQPPPGLHLPAISPPIPQSTTPNSTSSFSLPLIFPDPMDVSSARTMATATSCLEPTEAAAAPTQAAAAAGGGVRLSGDGSARVSKASSSVRSEQSVGSLSPDRAAAKERRHKVKSRSDYGF